MSGDLSHTVYICSDFAICRKHKLGLVRSAAIQDLSSFLSAAARDYCRSVVSRLCGVPSEEVFFMRSFCCDLDSGRLLGSASSIWEFRIDSRVGCSSLSFFFCIVIE